MLQPLHENGSIRTNKHKPLRRAAAARSSNAKEGKAHTRTRTTTAVLVRTKHTRAPERHVDDDVLEDRHVVGEPRLSEDAVQAP